MSSWSFHDDKKEIIAERMSCGIRDYASRSYFERHHNANNRHCLPKVHKISSQSIQCKMVCIGSHFLIHVLLFLVVLISHFKTAAASIVRGLKKDVPKSNEGSNKSDSTVVTFEKVGLPFGSAQLLATFNSPRFFHSFCRVTIL